MLALASAHPVSQALIGQEGRPLCSITACEYLRTLVSMYSQALPGSEVSEQYDDESESGGEHSEARGAIVKLS